MISRGRFNQKAVALLMIVAGLLCLLVAAAWAIYSWHLVSASMRATGRITQLIERCDGKGNSYFYPVFTYADRRGTEHTIDSNVGTYPPPHRVGDTVVVLYTPGSEQDARIDDWSVLWGIPLLLVFLGVVGATIGVVVTIWPRITRR